LLFAAAILPALAGQTQANEAPSTASRKVAYSRDIKPLLANHCYACHGPDAGQRKADLRLDVREAALESAIVPGDSASSELVSRITSDDPKMRMPPVDSNIKPLSPEQIDLLRRWVGEGANFDTHWSYVRPASVRPPDAGNPAWADAPIDRFIAAGHAAQGLELAPETDRVTLIVPPSRAEPGRPARSAPQPGPDMWYGAA